jgi:DNA (cytosine-5)-methyltransferase 1
VTTAQLFRRDVRPGDDWERSPLGILLPPRERRRYDRPVAVDFFAGAGGMSMGLHNAGFHVAAAVEMWPTAAVTYTINLARPGRLSFHFDTPEREQEFNRQVAEHLGIQVDKFGHVVGPDPKRKGITFNRHGHIQCGAGSGWISGQPADHPGCEHMFVADIRNLSGAQILDALDLDQGDVALVAGGPPCQGFSHAGRRRVMDPRNSLVLEYARLICEIAPRSFVMEQVPGVLSMTTPEGIPVMDAFAIALAGGGYGEYEALRSMLTMADGRRVGRRGAKGVEAAGSAAQDAPELDDEAGQLDLFGGAS